MTSFPSKGETFAYSVETALGTDSGAFSNIRYLQDSLKPPYNTRTLIANPNMGHRHAYDISDKAIPVQAFMDGGLTFSDYIRRSASANTNPPIASFFESAGWEIKKTTATTVASYVSTTAFDLGASGDAYGKVGDFILVKLEDGTSALDEFYYPVFVAAKATNTITPAMALPAASANSEPIEVMTTMWPQCRVVPSTKTLSFQHNLRATHTSGEDLCYEYVGCALKSVGEMTLKCNEAPTLAMTYHVGTVDQKTLAIANETFVSSEKFAVVTHDCRVELAAANSAGGIARTDAILIEAKVDFGFECTPRIGFGSGTLAGIQGYSLKPTTPKITITADFSKTYWDEIEGSNASQYLCIAQPTSSLATPAFAICMPRCHIDHATALVLDRGGDTITCTVTYIGSVSDYNSETDNDDPGAAPIFFGISGASS